MTFVKLRTLLLHLQLVDEGEEQKRKLEKEQGGGSFIAGIRRSRSMPKMDFDSIPDILAPSKLFKASSPDDKPKAKRMASAESDVGGEEERGRALEPERKRGFRGKSRERLKLRSKSKERKEEADVVTNPLFGLGLANRSPVRPSDDAPVEDASTPMRANSRGKRTLGSSRTSANSSPEAEAVVKVNPVFGLAMSPSTFGTLPGPMEAKKEKPCRAEVVVVNPLFGVEDPRIPRRDPATVTPFVPAWRTYSWSHDVVSRFAPMGRSSTTTHSTSAAVHRLRKPTKAELLETIETLQKENTQLQKTVRRLEKKKKRLRRLEIENKALRAQLASATD